MSTLATSKLWKIKKPNPGLQVKLCQELDIHPIVAQLFINRGIETVEEAKTFLTSNIGNLHDPFLLTDMDKAVARIKKARDNKEKVLIFGDYDVDGVTSSALLNRALRKFGLEVINHIPHRVQDGYGLNERIGAVAKGQGVTLLISVDCGITAHREVEILNQMGIDVIILDHHEPGHHELPKAVAIINPKRSDCAYPFKFLAACGLAAKLIQALYGEIPQEYIDLVAVGTIADIVPLRGENRIFVKQGLKQIPTTKNFGLSALINAAKLKGKKFQPSYVGFIIGPRINASGRMDSAAKSLELLLAETEGEAIELAQFLEKQNAERQKLQRDVVQQAMSLIEREVNFNEHRVIVLGAEGWHRGVLGIVASRITDQFYRPAIVISLDNGIGTASARSIEGFHLHEALTHCSELLEEFGGHKLAAGLTIKTANIEKFRTLINDFAKTSMVAEDLIPALNIDCEIPVSTLNMDLVEMIDSLEPYGEGNPAPVFCSRGLIVKTPPQVMGKETLKFWVTDGKVTVSVVGFGMATKYASLIKPNQKVDLAYQLGIDDWNQQPTVHLKLKDIKI